MKIAAMRVRITFQKNAVIVDKYGNHKNGWADYFSCWATAGSNNAVSGTGTGSESTGVVIRSEESLSFTCRWCSEQDRLRGQDLQHHLCESDGLQA